MGWPYDLPLASTTVELYLKAILDELLVQSQLMGSKPKKNGPVYSVKESLPKRRPERGEN